MRRHEGCRVPVTAITREGAVELPFDCAFRLGPIEMDTSRREVGPVMAGVLEELLTTGGSDLVFSRVGVNACSPSTLATGRLLVLLCEPPSSSRPRLEVVRLNMSGLSELGLTQVFTAVAATRSTTHLELYMDFDWVPPAERAAFWGMLAYAVFSKCSRSTVTRLSVFGPSITIEEAVLFAAVLEANDPAELVFGRYTRRGDTGDDVGGADARCVSHPSVEGLLQRGATVSHENVELAPAVWKIAGDNTRVIVLHDDGKSTKVDVLIPGYGLCRTSREYILPATRPSSYVTASEGQVTALTTILHEDIPGWRRGLLRLLDLIGAPLKHLTLQVGDFDDQLGANDILGRCPNLETLDVRPLPTKYLLAFTLHRLDRWQQHLALDNVSLLTRELTDPTTPTAQNLRHVAYGYGFRASNLWDDHTAAIVEMLERNRTLEYLSLIVPDDASEQTVSQLKRFHHEPLPVEREPLPFACRLAFISIFNTPRNRTDVTSIGGKRAKTATLSSQNDFDRCSTGTSCPSYSALRLPVCGVRCTFAAAKSRILTP